MFVAPRQKPQYLRCFLSFVAKNTIFTVFLGQHLAKTLVFTQFSSCYKRGHNWQTSVNYSVLAALPFTSLSKTQGSPTGATFRNFTFFCIHHPFLSTARVAETYFPIQFRCKNPPRHIFSPNFAEKWLLHLRRKGNLKAALFRSVTVHKVLERSNVEFRCCYRMLGSSDCLPYEWQVFLAVCSFTMASFASIKMAMNMRRCWIDP